MNNTRKYFENIKFWIFIAVLVILLMCNTSMNFTFLGFIAIFIGIWLRPQFKSNEELSLISPKKGHSEFQTMCVRFFNADKSWYAMLYIIIFTILCLFTLSNYFYADSRLYTNNEHHALRLDGVRIDNPKDFVLVKDSKDAFFDDENFHGSVIIESVDDYGVTLKSENFTHPIYRHKVNPDLIKGEYKTSVDTIINNADVIRFTAGDEVTFINKSGKKLYFKFDDIDMSFSGLIKHKRDSAYYYFKLDTDTIWQKSKFKTLLTQGISINRVLDSVDISSDDFDMGGINIIRCKAEPRAKNIKRSEKGKTLYALEFTNDAFGKEDNKIVKVKVNDEERNLSGVNSTKIPYDALIYFGSGENKTKPFRFIKSPKNNAVAIEFYEPIYQQLYSVEDNVENTLYVTSSIINDTDNSDSEVGVNVPNNVLSFNLFDKNNNVNHFKPFSIYFSCGRTMERMSFIYEQGDKLSPSKKIEGREINIEETYNEEGNVAWIFHIENLRESTPFKADKMMLIVLVVGLISALAINLNRILSHILGWETVPVYKGKSYHRNTFSYVEFVAYLTIIFLITVRCFIMWRTSVFRPLESISQFELNDIFYKTSHLKSLIFSLVVFYGVIIALKIFISIYKFRENMKDTHVESVVKNDKSIPEIFSFPLKYKKKSLKWNIVISSCFLFLYMFIGLILSSWNSRIALVLVVGLYFLIDIIINITSEHKTFNEIEDSSKSRQDAISTFIHSIANMAIAAVAMIKDSGFMVMFLTFCIVSIIIKLLEFHTKLKDIWSIIIAVVVFIIVSCVLRFYKHVMIFMFNNSCFIFILFVLVAILIWLLMLYAQLPRGVSIKRLNLNINCMANIRKIEDNKGLKWTLAVLWFVIILGVGFGICRWISDKPLSDLIDSDSTKQRINVQLYEPHEAIAKIESNEDESAFLQASYNHWIIKQYNTKGRDVKLFGQEGEGFFKIQPQSKIGALWNAQVTDIVVLRYIISEHSEWLVVVALGLLMLMLFCGLRMTTYYRFTKSLLIQIPLLIFIQALIVWLSNTQRFIFLGQDFPLLSITATVMIGYIFILLLLWVICAIIESVMCRSLMRDDFEAEEKFNKTHSHIFLVAILSIVGFYYCINLFKFKDRNDDNRYNMEQLFELETVDENDGTKKSIPTITSRGLRVIDSLFVLYQNDVYREEGRIIELNNNMHSEMVKFNDKCKDDIDKKLDSIAKNYLTKQLEKKYANNKKKLEKEKKKIEDNKRNKKQLDDYKFIQRIWENYVNIGSYNNSYERIMHVHKPTNNITYNFPNSIFIVDQTDFLHISLRKDFYELRLPDKHTDSWKGNIVETSATIKPEPTTKTENNYKYYQIPTSWVKDGQTYHMLKRTGNKDVEIFSLSTNQKIKLEANGVRQVMALHDKDDRITIDNKKVELPIETYNYWARNILVNGKQTFLYPAGSELYWIYDFANVVKQVEEAKAQKSDKDVPITLDRELTNELYGTLRESTDAIVETPQDTLTQRSVIVVDGNGHIKAMVDYKYGYVLNPNDYETISELSEELYMNADGGRISKETNYFENRNLAHLRGGPGSSQKPLVWYAVASAIDFNWKDLTLVKIHGDKVDYADDGQSLRSSHFIIKEFNGEVVSRFRSLGSDELAAVGSGSIQKSKTIDVDLKHYLAHSSNYYSALMVYLGLHSADLYGDNSFINVIGDITNKDHVFRKFKNPNTIKDKKEYQDNYPFMKVKLQGKYEYVALGKPIERMKEGDTNYVNHLNNSILHNQMKNAFGMEDAYEGGRSQDKLYADYLVDSVEIENKKQYKDIYLAATIPAKSSINFDKFEHTENNAKDGWGFVHTNNIVRSIATGDGAAWNVTPMKMAEMYGKMFITNSAFSCTFNPNEKYDISQGDIIGNWSENFRDALPVMYESMNLFFYDDDKKSGRSATGTGIEKHGPFIKVDAAGACIKFGEKTYYIYGKTGTSNSIKRSKDDYFSLLKISSTYDLDIKKITNAYDNIKKKDVSYYRAHKEDIDKAYKSLVENGFEKYERELDKEYRRLAIIISDTKMHDISLGDSIIKPGKFYVLYFTYDYNYKDFSKTSYEIIEKVVKSECFQNYMNN